MEFLIADIKFERSEAEISRIFFVVIFSSFISYS